jgi:hypothetical protein
MFSSVNLMFLFLNKMLFFYRSSINLQKGLFGSTTYSNGFSHDVAELEIENKRFFLGVCPLLGLLIFISEKISYFCNVCTYLQREREIKRKMKVKSEFHKSDIITQIRTKIIVAFLIYLPRQKKVQI